MRVQDGLVGCHDELATARQAALKACRGGRFVAEPAENLFNRGKNQGKNQCPSIAGTMHLSYQRSTPRVSTQTESCDKVGIRRRKFESREIRRRNPPQIRNSEGCRLPIQDRAIEEMQPNRFARVVVLDGEKFVINADFY